VLRVINELEAGTAKPQTQDRAAASKAPRLEKEDGLVDWTQPATAIKNKVRALDPWPRAFTWRRRDGGEPVRLILHQVDVVDEPTAAAAPGTIVEAGPRLVVAAGRQAVDVLRLQPGGKRVMTAAEFLRGYPLPVGSTLGA
jgi:methionyl-tRNA formyltransferase